MRNLAQTSDSFPTALAATSMTAVAVALLPAGLWLAARLGGSTAGVETNNAVVFASATAWLAAVCGLVPIHIAGPRGVDQTIAAYFIGTALRTAVCVAAVCVGVKIFSQPLELLILAVSGIYVPLLLVEAAFVGRYLWMKDQAGPLSAAGRMNSVGV